MAKSKGARVADILPSWEGTPFHPHARVKGAGVDCKGLPWAIADELGFKEAQSEYAQALDYDLTRADGIPSARLREGFEKLFKRVELEDRKPGDLLLCKWNGKPAHIAILGHNDRAYNALPEHGVKPRTLRALFHVFPLDSVWRWRGR